MLKFFWDQERGGFFFTAADSEELLFRQKEIYDGAIPSGNSVAVLNLIRLARMLVNPDWETKADVLFQAFAAEILQRPSAYTQLLLALDFAVGPSSEIVLAATDLTSAQTMLKLLNESFLPNMVVLFRPQQAREQRELFQLAPFLKEQASIGNQPTVYVCQNHICQRPVTLPAELEKQLQSKPD